MRRPFVAVRYTVAGLVLSLVIFFHPQAARAATAICGAVGAGIVNWTPGNSPYQVCAAGADVPLGVTLNLAPGTEVQFAQGSGDRLSIEGSLAAAGTPEQPITFTAVVATPGSWAGLYASGSAANPAQVSLDNVWLGYGGSGTSTGGLYAYHAAVTITHSFIGYGNGDGVFGDSFAQLQIDDTTFYSNTLNAVQWGTPSFDLLLTNLRASLNGTNGVRLSGSNTPWPGQHRWANPGLPYIVDSNMGNTLGDVLTIDPGVQLEFAPNTLLGIGGQLKAVGTPTEPITLTGQTQAAGSWRGLQVIGGTVWATAQLDYVTIDYAGSNVNGANIELQNGSLIARHSTVAFSATDGIRLDSSASVSIVNSQIYSNTAYGIRNGQPASAVLASSDWWGDPGGPRSDVAGCSSGLGDRVTAGVLFNPVLTSPGLSTNLALNSAPTITLSPRRWFAPADGVTRVYFDITLHDGNGLPLPGRTVLLATSLGSKVDGGITDALGHTLAYLTSSTTGDANVTATLSALTACEAAQTPSAKVTFTAPIAGPDLMPDAPSPYANGAIRVAPLPVIVGVPTTIYAQLSNPLTTAVVVDVEFDIVQSSIGLAFGPIANITGKVIPAQSSVTLSANFVPPVSGHYCAQVIYNITAVADIAGAQGLTTQAQQLKPFNFNSQPASTGGGGKDNQLQKTRTSLKNVNRFVNRAYDTGPIVVPLAVANAGIEWDLNNAEKISNALQGDPPRQDYSAVTLPHVLKLAPTQAGGGISAARATALNALDDALAQANAYGQAAADAYDRAGGAAAAGNLNWESVQTGIMLENNRLMGTELITAAMKIDDLIAVAASEGVTSVVISASDVISMQQSLAAGFSTQEIADAHAVGLTDADIEAVRQSILTARPTDLAGDVITHMKDIGAQFRTLAGVLMNPPVFAPQAVVAGAGVIAQAATTNNLAQVFDTVTTVPLGNPNPVTTTITLQARRISLPADWTVNVSPAQVTLAPGQQVTVTLDVTAGSPVAQGISPQVAVEGWVGSQLLGGVVVDMMVPTYRPYDGHLYNYVPLVRR